MSILDDLDATKAPMAAAPGMTPGYTRKLTDGDLFSVLGAAIDTTWYGDLYHSLQLRDGLPDPSFNAGPGAAEALEANPKLKPMMGYLSGSMSSWEFEDRKAMAERITANKEMLSEAGSMGLFAQLATGALDPISFMGIGPMRRAVSMLEAVKASPAIVAKQVGLSSAISMATNPDYGMTDVAQAMMLGQIAGPIMGAGFYWDAQPSGQRRLMASSSLSAAGNPNPVPTGAAATGVGLEKLPTSAMARALNSGSVAEADIAKRLFSAPYADNANRAGVVNPDSAEVGAWRWQGRLADTIGAQDDAWMRYRTGETGGLMRRWAINAQDFVMGSDGKLTQGQFKDRVWSQVIGGRGDDAIGEVNEAAAAYRKLFDEFSDERVRLGFAEQTTDALSWNLNGVRIEEKYAPRIWNEVAIRDNYREWEQTWSHWQSMLPADHPHLKVGPREAADWIQLERPFVGVTDNVVGEAKSMHARTMGVPSSVFSKFLNRDIEALARFYTRTMGTDLEIGRRFRDGDKPDVLLRSARQDLLMETAAKLNDLLPKAADPYAAGNQRPGQKVIADYEKAMKGLEAQAKADYEELVANHGIPPIERVNKIRQQFDADRKLVEAQTIDFLKGAPEAAAAFSQFLKSAQNVEDLRDLLRGTFGQVADPFSVTARSVRVAKQLTAMTLLTGAIAALPDVGNLVLREGMWRSFAPAFEALRGNTDKLIKNGSIVKEAGVALDLVLNSRAVAISDLSDIHGRYSTFERVLDNMSAATFVLNLMSPWTAFMKQYAGVSIQSGLEVRMRKALAGTLPDAEQADLARAGVSRTKMADFLEQMDAHGERLDGVFLPNSHLWTNDVLRREWQSLVAENANRIVVTPSKGEIPNWMSTQIGSVIGQFKSFGVATMNRVVIPALQEKDQRLMSGIAMLVGAGLIVDQIRHSQGNDHRNRSTREILGRAVERSGVLGYLTDVGRGFDALTDGRFGYGALIGQPNFNKGFADGVLDLAGPAAQQGKKIANVAWDLGPGDANAKTARDMRSLMPFFGRTAHVDWSADMIEGAFKSAVAN